MFPVYIPDDQNRTPRSRRTALMFIALGGFMSLGLMLLLLLRSTAGPTPWVLIAVGIPILVLIPLSIFVSKRGDGETDGEAKDKGKRGLEGLDLYSVIDRLVADLDDEEADYLQRRLDERAARRKDDLTVSIDDLLEQRAEDKRDQ